MKLAVVGATGLVGGEILEVLDERDFQFDELFVGSFLKDQWVNRWNTRVKNTL
jgi:aspartate-semialdehyde dehydrogenase